MISILIEVLRCDDSGLLVAKSTELPELFVCGRTLEDIERLLPRSIIALYACAGVQVTGAYPETEDGTPDFSFSVDLDDPEHLSEDEIERLRHSRKHAVAHAMWHATLA